MLVALEDLPLKETILAITLVIYSWNTYLDLRQYRKLGESKVPKPLKDVIDQKTFDKSRAYGRDKSFVKFVNDLFNLTLAYAFIQYNGYAFFWNLSESLFTAAGYGSPTEITQSMVFVILYGVFTVVIGLPKSLYATFVVEQRHGFNKQTLGLFVSDTIKSLVIGIVIGCPVLAGVISIIQTTGKDFALYVWGFMLCFQLLMITIYPTLIQPLFNKFTPLEEGEMKTAIDTLAKRIDFPLTKVFVVDGSKRSGHSNAYFFGFFKNKRIVLFDTLLEQNSQEETLAVLAHELGHWKYNHVLKMLITSNIQSLITYYIFGFVLYYSPLFDTFGFAGQRPVVIGFLLFSYIFAPVDEIIGFLAAVTSRRFEYQADNFADGLGYNEQLKSGLIKLNKENLGNVNPDPLFSAWHHSHPSLMERLTALDAGKKTAKKTTKKTK